MSTRAGQDFEVGSSGKILKLEFVHHFAADVFVDSEARFGQDFKFCGDADCLVEIFC